MSEPLLRLSKIQRVFDSSSSASVRALGGIDLEIFEGEFVAIVGPSGGGKTTLLSLIGLLDSPSAGEYLINGAPTSSLSEAETTRLRAKMFGFIFQSFHLLDRRPIEDSAGLALFHQGASRAERTRRTSEALSSLGLAGREHDVASKLSGGQRQRVAIARAVASGNPVILADEPTGNLDSRTGAAVLAEFQQIHASGGTVIVVTHSDDVAGAADRVVRIMDGQIVSDTGSKRPEAPPRQTVQSWTSQSNRLLISELARESIRSVLSRRGQSLALVLAVGVAVAMMIISLGLGASAQAQVSDTFDARANREVGVTWNQNDLKPVSEAASLVATLAGVTAVAGLVDHGEVSVSSREHGFAVTLQGVVGDLEEATSSAITWASNAASVSGRNAIVGRSLARQLELGPLALRPTVDVSGESFVVVGILEDSVRFPLLSGQVLLAESAAEEKGSIGTSQLAITTESGAAAQVGKFAASAIDPLKKDLYVTAVPVDPQGLRQEIEGGVKTTLLAFTALAILVAVVTLGNAITSSVMARFGELGLRRAVGARGNHLAYLVATEAGLVGIAGGIVGLFAGIITLLIFTISQRWLPVFDVWLAPLAVVAGVTLATLGSLVGAYRAAHVSPIAALRG